MEHHKAAVSVNTSLDSDMEGYLEASNQSSNEGRSRCVPGVFLAYPVDHCPLMWCR